MNKVPYIQQMEHSECGLACVAMILNYEGYSISLPEIRDKFGTSKSGTSLHNLIEMGKEYHLNGKAFKANILALKTITLPAIIFWENKHYVVLEKVGKNKLTIMDPALGRRIFDQKDFIDKYSGYVLTFTLTKAFVKKKKKSGANFLLTHIIKQKKLLISLILVSLILQGVGLIIPKITQWITDDVILPGNKDYITIIGICILSLYLYFQVFSIIRVYMIARIQTLIDSSLMSTFISKMFNLPYSFFETRTSGDLIHRANSNIFIRQILSSRVIALVIDILLIVVYAGLMFYIKWKLALVVLLLSFLILVSMLISTKLIRKLSDTNLIAQTKTQSYLTESIQGISDVKVLGAEEKTFNHWFNLFKNQLKVSQKQNFLSSSLETFGIGIQYVTPLVLLWLGSGSILKGEMTLGELLGFSALASTFMVPIVSMGTTYSQFLLIGTYMQRLQDVVDSKAENFIGEDIDDFKGRIELKDVSFKYDFFGDDIISSINLTIERGEKVAIVGSSGSGKSTLSKLLLGLYLPTQGIVSYDGNDINNLNLQSLRRKIGSVLQETRLFHGSILDNIHLLNDTPSLNHVVAAAKIADIHEDILNLPMGYNTMISEAGSNFSGGQRQRLLLARALINNPKILILDEATSALDNLTESRVQHNLQQLKCTQIIIAHRLSTVIDADRILVMHKGTIVESGTHLELLNKKGYYNDLYHVNKENVDEKVYI